jgi:hypothetical protein
MQDWRHAKLGGQLGRYRSRQRRVALHLGLAVACLALICAHRNMAQSPTAPGGALRLDKAGEATPINQPPDANAQLHARARRFQQKSFDAANALRIRQIADETEKLLILARDLQSQLDKIGGKPLPALLMREAEVIEKLAHDVQSRMTLTVGAG